MKGNKYQIKQLLNKICCYGWSFLLLACTSQGSTENSTAQKQIPTQTDTVETTTPAQINEPAEPEKTAPKQEVSRLAEYTTSRKYVSFSAQSLAAWQKALPEIQNIKVTSSLDGKKEPALFYTSGSDQKKPLLVVLHSWSDEYLQQASIPFALWAKKYDWVFIQPNYRGIFQTPEAMGSDLAVQDIADAVQYAKKNANVDTTRIYVTGASGGGMGSLLAASRNPDIWAGVVAWVPVVDISSWYEYNKQYPTRKYRKQIEAAAGGNPLTNSKAAAEVKHRSPITHVSKAKNVPIYIAHGINDRLVPPDHALHAYNLLAAPADRITPEQIEYIVKNQAIPESLKGAKTETYFGKQDPAVVFATESDNVKLVLFNGVHDMVYNPTLLWLNEQQKR